MSEPTECVFRNNEPKFMIYRYLQSSCGNGGIPTDHTIRCFVGMIEGDEATWSDFAEIAGEYVVQRMIRLKLEVGV